MDDREAFGRLLKRQRKARDLTQEALAQRAYCAVDTIKKIEAGARRPSRQLAVQFADCLDLAGDERAAFLSSARLVAGDAAFAPNHITAPIGSTPAPATPTRHSNLLTPATRLIGRQHEVAVVSELPRRADVRLVTLTGPGGVGKTRLALQIAAELLDMFADGVWFVNLAPITDPTLVVSTIAQTLGVTESGGQPLFEHLTDHLREQQLLLVLDNFEQVVAAASQVADLLAACPQLKALITSRDVLHLSGEHEFPVPPLRLPPQEPRTGTSRVNQEPGGINPDSVLGSRFSVLGPVEEIAQYEAVRLFLERAQAAKPDFMLSNQNAAAVTKICHRLDGLPLAIELAAARIKLFSPDALLARLSSPLQVLTGGARDLPARQQTMRATIEWSYQLLKADEQALFTRLGVFVGGFTLEAAEAVANADGELSPDVVDGVAALLDQSLLRQVEGPNGESRFEMLETIRAYALERLEESAKSDAIRQRHASYFCAALHAREADLGSGGRPIEASDEIAADIDNIRTAWQWAVDHDDIACLQRALESLNSFYVMRGMAAEGMAAFDRAIDKLSTAVAGEPTPERMLTLGRLLVRQGWLLLRANQLGSRETMQRGVELLGVVEVDTRAERAAALGDLSSLQYSVSGDPAQAEESIMNGLALAMAVESDNLVAYLLMIRAQMLEFQGESRTAAEQFRASLALYDNTDDLEGRAYALNNWGRAAYAMGEYPQARRLIEDALNIRQHINDQYGVSYSLLDLGRLAEFAGDYVQARELIGQSLAVSEQLQSGDHSARAYVALGAVAHAEGQLDQAENYFQRALQFWRDHRAGRGPSLCLNGLAEVALDRGDKARARAYLAESLTIAQQLRNVGEAAVAELGLGRIALASGALDQAAAHLRQALQVAERTGAAPLALDALIVAAQLNTSGRSTPIERAVELLALATTHPAARQVTRAQAARVLDTVIATLSPQVAQAARTCGQALDLWATVQDVLVDLESTERGARAGEA